MNNLIGRCVQFDISENGYKEGIIKNLNGDCVTILQDGEIYKGEYYRAFEIMLLVYREVLLYKNNIELEYMTKYQDVIKNIAKINTAENICKKMHLILDSKNSLNANLNLGLVLDNLIFKMGEC